MQRSALLTLPSPGYLAELTAPEDGALADVGADWGRLIQDEVAAVAADGVPYVLLTNPLYAFLLSTRGQARAASLGIDSAAVLRRMLAVDALVLAGLSVPENFRIGLDLTTGGLAVDESGYSAADLGWFVENQPFGRLCVEYPAAEASRFPLELLAGGPTVSIGLVDVSTATIESVDELVGRVDDAAAIVDIDDIALSTNGAFGAAGVGAVQPDKLQLVEMVARYFWGNEL